MNSTFKTMVFWAVIVISAILLWQVVRSNNPAITRNPEISYSAFISKAQSGEITSVTITGTRIQGEYREGKGAFQLTGPSNPAPFLATLQEKGVEIRFRDEPSGSLPLQLLGTWAPLLLLAALWLAMMRRFQRRNSHSGPGGPDSSGSIG